MTVLVGFAGASGSGKTTLMNELHEELDKRGYEVGVVSEVTRTLFKSYNCSSMDELRQSGDLMDFQTDILEMQYLKEKQAMEIYDIVLSDRTIHDNVAYLLIHHNKDLSGLINYFTIYNTFRLFHNYDLIFYCPPLYHVDIRDGFRTEEDIKSRPLQDAIINILLEASNNKVEKVPALVLSSPSHEIKLRTEFCLRKVLELIE